MKKLYCLTFFYCLFINTKAQGQDAAPVNAAFITQFPFTQYSGGVMVIKAKLGSVPDSLHFILDTGCGGISLDSGTCAYYHLKTVPTDTVINGMGGQHKVAYLFNESLQLPGLTLNNLNFHINDYSLLAGVYGEKIDGIIGYSFFKRFIVKMDFDNLMLEVFTPGHINYPKGGSVIRPSINRLPVQRATITDRKKIGYNFYFDTGAGLCFLMSKAFASDSNVLLKRRKPVDMQAEGLGGKLPVKLTVVKCLQIGKYHFSNVPAYIYDDESNVTAYPSGGGLVGIDLLRRFNLIVNYAAGEIHLLPNGHFDDLFDYAYTGLGIYYQGGIIYIEDVIADSPGEKAGIHPGDILVGVDNNLSNNILAYKALLQSARGKILLLIKRGGELKLIEVKPGTIF